MGKPSAPPRPSAFKKECTRWTNIALLWSLLRGHSMWLLKLSAAPEINPVWRMRLTDAYRNLAELSLSWKERGDLDAHSQGLVRDGLRRSKQLIENEEVAAVMQAIKAAYSDGASPQHRL